MPLFDFFGASAGSIPRGAPDPDQPHELLLYKSDYCGYCRRVSRAIERLDIDVPTADTVNDPDSRRRLREVTGRTTVPCLFIDGQPLFESLDIIAWLEAYAEGGAKAA